MVFAVCCVATEAPLPAPRARTALVDLRTPSDHLADNLGRTDDGQDKESSGVGRESVDTAACADHDLAESARTVTQGGRIQPNQTENCSQSDSWRNVPSVCRQDGDPQTFPHRHAAAQGRHSIRLDRRVRLALIHRIRPSSMPSLGPDPTWIRHCRDSRHGPAAERAGPWRRRSHHRRGAALT